jgi:hypothetical protein
MATSFTPGLRVARHTEIVKERKLPLLGNVTVNPGDKISYDKVVARTDLPGDIYPVQVAHTLGIEPVELKDAMLKKEGDKVSKGEVIALTRSFFGMFKSECLSPIDGSVESISYRTGQVILQRPPIPVEVNAFIQGTISEVLDREGVIITTRGALIQGIFGVGGEAWGDIKIATNGPKDILDASLIQADMKGKVIVGGNRLTMEALDKAREIGVSAIIVGGFDKSDLRDLLGFELGVAITGNEDLGITLVLTEGYGAIPMTARTWELLKDLEGRHASINGATQIRAGVIRPEIIVPMPDEDFGAESVFTGELSIGSEVRIIRQPWFGQNGRVTALPPAPTEVESGATVRVLEVETEDGNRVILPRANIELIGN